MCNFHCFNTCSTKFVNYNHFSDVERTNESALEKLKNRVMKTNDTFSNTLSLFESKNKEYLEIQNKLSGNVIDV